MIKVIHMRSIIIFLVFIIATGPLHSQVPSQKEMQAQMKEVVDELNKQIADLEKQIEEAKKNKEDPEIIREMEEQLALLKKQLEMMGGVTKGLAKMPEKSIKKAIEKDSIEQLYKVSVPKLDKKRIAMIPKETLSDSQLTAFVSNVHSEVERLIPKDEKEEASKIYTAAKTLGKTSNTIGNIATNLWLSGNTTQAIYLLGKECATTRHANNLNNYAALLIMSGGEHAAIPILQNLGKNFPDNSTIMNNIGQAWYALGDMNKAKYALNMALGTFENHSQANQTLCWIQKSEGNDQGAIESLKRSLQEVYTTEKDHLLDKLGGKLKYRDFCFPYPGKKNTVEQLGIDRFIRAIPPYPFEGGEVAEKSQAEWYDFRQKVIAAREVVDKKLEFLKKQVDAHNKRLQADPKLLEPFNNHVHRTARRKQMVLSEWYLDRMSAMNKEHKEASDSIQKWGEEYNNVIRTSHDCGTRKDAANTYNLKANKLYQKINAKNLNYLKAYNNTLARLALYTSTDQSEYLLIIESIKAGVLTVLYGLPCVSEVGCVPSSTPQPGQSGPLPDFDSLKCDYKNKIFIPPFTTITTECNIMTTEVEVGSENLIEGLELKLKLGIKENLNSGKITKGTLEIGIEAGVDGNIGPVKGELKGGVAGGIEITSDGVQEVYVKTTASAEWTGHVDEADPKFVIDPTVSSKGTPVAEAELKVSWNAGPTGEWGFQNSTTSASASSTVPGTVTALKNIILKAIR